MKLILIRHGDAGAYTLPDDARNLSTIGHQQAKQTAQWLTQHYQPDHLISSPYQRAKQTMAYIQQNFLNLNLEICQHITPDHDPCQAIEHLSNIQADCLVVVCHMNIIAHIASILIGQNPEPFQLAEARVYQMPVIAPDLAMEIQRFVPKNFT